MENKSLTLDDRYNVAAGIVLNKLRKANGKGLEETMTDILARCGISLSDNPTAEEATQYRAFCERLYPALDRLADLRARTIESLHSKDLAQQTVVSLTKLLSVLNGDIEMIKTGKGKSPGSSPVNIQINNYNLKELETIRQKYENELRVKYSQ